MPIRRILTIVREQYASLQKRFGSNSEKKEASAAVVAAEADAEAAEPVVAEEIVAEEAPIASDAKPAA